MAKHDEASTDPRKTHQTVARAASLADAASQADQSLVSGWPFDLADAPLSGPRRRLPAPLAVLFESVLMIMFWDISYENAIAFFFVMPLIAMIGWRLAGILISRRRSKAPAPGR